MRIAIATDAWHPQVNGVVRTLVATIDHLRALGHAVEVFAPERFRTLPMPGYGAIRLAMAPRFGLRRMLADFAPDIVHISTEGPIGWAARGWGMAHDVPFTSAFHTRFPDYIALRTGISAEWFWPVMRRFHAPSRAVLVATASLADELAARGITHTRRWSRGIDQAVFRPEGPPHPALANLPGPVLLNVGRVAAEKNLEAFLEAPASGSKVVVGDGPALGAMRQKYPGVLFMGALAGEELASAYRGADCFVFPSLTDTFGLVVIEALACGVPVAAYPVAGPVDILGRDGCGGEGRMLRPAGVLHDDLAAAIAQALTLDRQDAAGFGAHYTWERATGQFLQGIRHVVQTPLPALELGLA